MGKLTERVHWPEERVQLPRLAVPFKKVIVPVGTMALAVEETVAVSVVLLLIRDGLTELVSVVCEGYATTTLLLVPTTVLKVALMV